LNVFRFQGEAEGALQRIFEEAVLNAPCLLLIDDLELLCPQRSQMLSDLQRRIVSCMLTLIDGVVTSPGTVEGNSKATPVSSRVFILATSSQPSLIDTAMRRPGRLDREVELGVPTPTCRGQILQSLLGAMGAISTDNVTSDINEDFIQSLSQKSHGMVGADLLLVCKEAHMNALDRVSGLPYRISHSQSDAVGNIDYSKVAFDTGEKLSQLQCGDITDDLVSRIDLNLHLDDDRIQSTPSTSRLGDQAKGYKLVANDLVAALGRVTPSAIREVTIEVPGNGDVYYILFHECNLVILYNIILLFSAEVHWTDIGGMESVKQSLREVQYI
jgi:SpoVK/Ycf46/Vps4 family AAA+-type ATPase